jgi:osmoprotectant transport system substrate-binding protein
VRRGTLGLILFALVSVVACGPGDLRSAPVPAGGVTVGSFGFSESQTLGEIYSQALEARGIPVRRAFALASREIVEPALEQGKIDVVAEYVGTASRFLGVELSAGDARQALAEAFAPRGVTVLNAAPAENQNGIVLLEATAQRLGAHRISDLIPVAPTLVFGGPPECPERPLCLRGLSSVYGLSFKQFRPLDAGGPATVAALEGGEVDVGLLFTTDGHLAGGEFRLLADDRALQPPENIVPVVRTAVVERHGSVLVDALNRVSQELYSEDLTALNRRVDIDRVPAPQVAKDWLREHGLV